jgi:hypothetical protein
MIVLAVGSWPMLQVATMQGELPMDCFTQAVFQEVVATTDWLHWQQQRHGKLYCSVCESA